MSLANTKPLPRQSRSTYCAKDVDGTKSRCRRLAGHNGDCRPTLTHVAVPASKPARRPKVRKARKAAVVRQCRVSKRGVRCSRPLGHKQAGKRHAFTGLVTQLPEGEANNRQFIGRSKRAKAAPLGTKSRSNAGALKGRVSPRA